MKNGITDWLFQDGLIIQLSFGIIAAAGFYMGYFLIDEYSRFDLLLSHPLSLKWEEIFAASLGILLFPLSFLWTGVCIAHPDSTWAQLGMKAAPDDASLALLILAIFLFIISAVIAFILRLVGIKGYPIEKYNSLYSHPKND